jgi:tight adherence protein C
VIAVPAVLALAVFCFVAAGATLVRSIVIRREIRASLDRAAGIAVAAPSGLGARGRRLPLVERLARLALLARPGADRDAVALRLAAAGLARRVSPETFLALQGAGLAASLLLGLAVASGGSVAGGLLLGLVGIGSALVVPQRLLAALAARRAESIRVALPGALDLLAISVEAGLGFDAALTRVADAIHGPLADEFTLMLAEIRVGETRAVALERLAERAGVQDVATFARAVIRADHLGTSLAQTLRVQAADARARRQVAAEEKAGKAAVKLLFPTIVFIFPALFVVVLGPPLMSFGSFLG